jgi:hypothetical protein
VVACRHVYTFLARPLTCIEHVNRLPRRPISTLIRLGSNPLRALIQIVMIGYWAHRQQIDLAPKQSTRRKPSICSDSYFIGWNSMQCWVCFCRLCNAFDAEVDSAVKHYKGIRTESDLISVEVNNMESTIMTRNFLQHKANPLHPAAGRHMREKDSLETKT